MLFRSGYTSAPSVSIAASTGTRATAHSLITSGGVKINNFNDYIASYSAGEGVVGEWAAKYPGKLGNSILVSIADQTTYTGWDYATEFNSTPTTSSYASNAGGSNDELHVVVVDADGSWTGTAGTVLEKYAFVSKASDAKLSDGTNNYYKDVINAQSKYIWWMDHTTSVLTTVNGAGTSGVVWGSTAANHGFKDLSGVVTQTLVGGADDLAPTDGNIMTAYDIFANAEQYDVS